MVPFKIVKKNFLTFFSKIKIPKSVNIYQGMHVSKLEQYYKDNS